MKAALAIVCLLPIVAESEILFVDYEGTVTSVSHSPGYAIGDAVSGRLTIDTLLAPPDRNPSPNEAYYGVVSGYVATAPDFVTGYLTEAGTDHVRVRNDVPWVGINYSTIMDVYFVSDDLFDGRAEGVDILARVRGLLDDDGIEQSFEVTSADVDDEGEGLFGAIRTGYERGVGFLISRLSVKPGRCFKT
jgi:hypothetical protein